MDSASRGSPRARSLGLSATGIVAVLFTPMGCAAQPAGQSLGVATPTPATAGPFVREVWEDAILAPAIRQEPESILTVTGVGEVEAVPDRAQISFAVETEEDTARETGEANAALMTRVSTALRAAGSALPGFRLETSGYSLSPRYGPTANDRPRIVGYTARNTIRVTVDQVEGLGPLIDGALAAGANRVAGLSFALRDPEPSRHEAVRLAVEKAHAEAEVIAAALGMRLGPPLEAQGGADYIAPFPYAATMDRAMEFAQAVPTPVEAGPQQVTARVTIRYRMDAAP